MAEAAKSGAKSGILSLTIQDKSVLYAAYMPFLKNGGLFIPTNKIYNMGDEVFRTAGAVRPAGGAAPRPPEYFRTKEGLGVSN